MLSKLTFEILLAAAIRATVVLYLTAMLCSVSPALTVYLTLVAGGGVVVAPGMTRTCPMRRKLTFGRLLAAAILATVVL
ncbi:DUF2537 domain-containing protein [Metaplanococcus flavidus]